MLAGKTNIFEHMCTKKLNIKINNLVNNFGRKIRENTKQS